MFANVIIEYGNKAVDREFTYVVPKEYYDKIKVGHRVLVPFNGKLINGFVLRLSDSYQGEYELKEINMLCDPEPILNEEMLFLGKEIQEEILCSKISIYQAMLPKGLKAKYKDNISTKVNRYMVLNKEMDEVNDYIKKCRYIGQINILEELISKERIKVDCLNSSINTLLKNDLVKFVYEDVDRFQSKVTGKYHIVTLNRQQENVCNMVNLDKFMPYLLYGVTGSGKTEVYMELIDRVLALGKNAIMLVPEISLTPQIVDRFATRFGSDIAILHSGLSDGEKYDEYRKILQGRVRIVVGARSAVFAPLKNIGIIVIDEEHTQTYKQENNPMYHARDVAMMRGKYHNAPVLLGSATPSLESFARAVNGVYKLLVLDKRAKDAKLPEVTIVDMKDEVKRGNFILSQLLKEKIIDRLNKNEQIILLLNRRGYSSMLTCRDCGGVCKCPNCDISLTYHKSSNTNRCHYCNYSIKNVKKCPYCGSDNIKEYGMGTEKLEEEIRRMFNARVVRMDMDTTSRKGMHEKIVNDFGNHEYDILLGTQMIAKGLDFPLVTLVGVINADASLNVPDFRSAEVTYQLLSQVSGRAGRSELAGEVVIQSYNPEHYSLRYAKRHNYLEFYKEEMAIRKKLSYSPYYYIAVVNISSRDYDYGFKEANKIGQYLRKEVDIGTKVLGPATANVFKINNVYHYQCIIKYKRDLNIKRVLKTVDEVYKINNKVDVCVDINPVRL